MTDKKTTNEDKKGKPPILDYELNHGELKDWEVRFYKRFGEGINYNAHPSVRVREFISDILAQAHTTLLERVEKEVIGEDDATHINGIIVRQNMMLTRNDMRAEQRTKLTQLREKLTKKD